MTTLIQRKVILMLRSAILTRDMKPEHLEKLALTAHEVEFAANEIIYNEADRGQAIHLVTAGEVVVERDLPRRGRVIVQTYYPGHFFGWSALFPEECLMPRTRAVKPAQLIAFDARQLKAICDNDYDFECNLFRLVTRAIASELKSARQLAINLWSSG